MDFDHVRGEKKFNLAVAANKNISIARIQDEIAKCDVVCANCHRERTFKRALSLTSKTPHFDCEVIGANPVVPSK